LEIARQDVANHIYNEHYKKYSRWPILGESQEGIILVKRKDKYDLQNGDKVFYAAIGTLTIVDKHEKINEYYTKVSGTINIAILQLVNENLEIIEHSASANFEKKL